MKTYLIFYKHYKITHKAASREAALEYAAGYFKPKRNEKHTVGAWRMKRDGSYDNKNQN